MRVVEGVNPSRPHVTSGNRYQRIGRGRVSEDDETIPLDVQAGEYVLVGKYSGTEIKLDGEDHLIVRARHACREQAARNAQGGGRQSARLR